MRAPALKWGHLGPPSRPTHTRGQVCSGFNSEPGRSEDSDSQSEPALNIPKSNPTPEIGSVTAWVWNGHMGCGGTRREELRARDIRTPVLTGTRAQTPPRDLSGRRDFLPKLRPFRSGARGECRVSESPVSVESGSARSVGNPFPTWTTPGPVVGPSCYTSHPGPTSASFCPFSPRCRGFSTWIDPL